MNEAHCSGIQSLRVSCWNMRGLSGSLPFVNYLLNDSDICIISEHHLYECELHKLSQINEQYESYGKSCNRLSNDNLYHARGYGGIAILWNKSLSNNIQKCSELGDDRICVIKLTHDGSLPLFIVGVYLPQRECVISTFDEYLYHLEYITEMCKSEGDVLICGDFNCHFGHEYGHRSWGKTTVNAAKLKGVVDRQSLSIMDLSSLCTGPKYTFNVEGVGTSYIDHCLVSDSLTHRVNTCEVLHDTVMNTSDHLALRVNLTVNVPNRYDYHGKHNIKLAWNKLNDDYIFNKYTYYVDMAIHDIFVDYLSKCGTDNEIPIDDLLQRLVDILITISNRNLPVVNTNKGKKPYWSKTLSNLSKAQKAAWHQWVSQGRPRDSLNPTWCMYKEAKKAFRTEQRKSETEHVQKCINELCDSQQLDARYFWSMVNRNRKRGVTVQATIDETIWGNIV